MGTITVRKPGGGSDDCTKVTRISTEGEYCYVDIDLAPLELGEVYAVTAWALSQRSQNTWCYITFHVVKAFIEAESKTHVLAKNFSLLCLGYNANWKGYIISDYIYPSERTTSIYDAATGRMSTRSSGGFGTNFGTMTEITSSVVKMTQL